MPDSKTLKIVVVILAGYAALLALGYLLPEEYGASLLIAGMPLLVVVYLLDNMGIPWLLEQNGLCGWGWCEPTLFGWLLAVVFWLVVAYLVIRYIVWIKK